MSIKILYLIKLDEKTVLRYNILICALGAVVLWNDLQSIFRKGEHSVFTKIKSMGLMGVDGFIIDIEADTSRGLPGFDVVGLPGAAVRESRDRVRSSMKNCGFKYPVSRITVNLAPADIKKEGPLYDLPLLVALLISSEQLDVNLENVAIVGELSLGGEIRPVRGMLPMIIAARNAGIETVFIPSGNSDEGAMVDGITIFPVSNVAELINHFTQEQLIVPINYNTGAVTTRDDGQVEALDFSDVRGQYAARRAIEVAAAGMHNVLLIGPPGSGKSMLAKRISSILPPMNSEEALESTKIHSISGLLSYGGVLTQRPFRSPHHGVSPAGLVGGGVPPQPGEISLAHNGVLFLDELPEFGRAAMEALRQPLEDEQITISRANVSLTYPSRVMLVAAMNPCPCGFFGHPTKDCHCSPSVQKKYISKISGPLLDRIDLHIEVPPVEYSELSDKQISESSKMMSERVIIARKRQSERFAGLSISGNAHMPPALMRKVCIMNDHAKNMLQSVFDKLGLSARAYDRILKVARTIADLEGSENIDVPHIAEAVHYRSLDRKYWN